MMFNSSTLALDEAWLQTMERSNCQKKHFNTTVIMRATGVPHCNEIFDSVTCWPPTPSGKTASMPCPTEFAGFQYNSKVNATRRCGANGEWTDRRSNYRSCMDGSQEDLNLLGVYISGYTLSILCLCSALFIFSHFKSLKCTRNYIHCHLISAFVLRAISFLILFLWIQPSSQLIFHHVLTMIYTLSHLAIFHWMLVEGLYLFKIIYCTYGLRKLRTRHFAIIGWGVPITLTICSMALNIVYIPHETWIKQFDYLTDIPIIIILILNACITLFIIHALVAKLRARRPLGIRRSEKRSDICSQDLSGPTRNHRMSYQLSRVPIEYRKAIKATLVLMPLLGFYYIIFITHYHPKVKFLFAYLNAILNSTQGFLVSLIYCFLNVEVRKLIRGRLVSLLETSENSLVSASTRVLLRLLCCINRSPSSTILNAQRVRSVYHCQGFQTSNIQKTGPKTVNFEVIKATVIEKTE